MEGIRSRKKFSDDFKFAFTAWKNERDTVKRTLLLILCLATVAMTVTQAKLHAQAALQPPLKGYFGYMDRRGRDGRVSQRCNHPAVKFNVHSQQGWFKLHGCDRGEEPISDNTHRDESQNTPGSDGH